ncbi:MAG: hypothetical protein E7568_06700 [Ruminococcaceae bacterium]|nr:hypothetical protein [Oscillospiraceae bacterium]
MVQNLKIDIIYYNTPSDFEFEFNLGGCCHSRVLNNRTHQPKEMLSSLAKAVSRSRVIIIVGETNGEAGLISLVSKAVGVPLSDVNTAEYGIKEPSLPKILDKSLPLVSKDGILCGCIVESGPQSIILLSENKSLRKDICDSLVFPYITAISRTPETEEVIVKDEITNQPEEIEEVLQEQKGITEETEVVSEEIADEEPSEEILNKTEEINLDNIDGVTDDIVVDSEIVFPANEETTTNGEPDNAEDSDIIFSGARLNFEENQEETIFLDDSYIIADDNDTASENYIEEKPKKKKAKKTISKLTISILILCGFLLITAGLILYLLVYEPTVNSMPVAEYLNEFFNFL